MIQLKYLAIQQRCLFCEKFKDIANMSKIITYMKKKISKLSMKQAYLPRLTPTGF